MSLKSSIELQVGDHFCERGETWLTKDDQHIAWFHIINSMWMEVEVCPGNYPGFNVNIVCIEEAELAAHIQKVCAGWIARKCNVKGVELDEGCVKDMEGTCECDNTHKAMDTVCQWCFARGRRKWDDPEVEEDDG